MSTTPCDPRRIAFADQARAAEAEADRISTAGSDPRRPPHDAPDWFTARLAAIVGAGPFQRCEHLTSPQVAYAGSWAPGRIVCEQCLDLDAFAARDTCDLCGPPTPCTRVLPTTSGALIVLVAACEACADAV